MSLLLAMLATVHAQSWPDDAAWIPVPVGMGVLEDGAADHGGAHASLDLVGAPASPVLQMAANDDGLYLRIGLADDPFSAPGDLRSGVWEVAIDLDDDGLVDRSIAIDGATDTVDVYQHDPGESSLQLSGALLSTAPIGTIVRSTQPGDWALDLWLDPDAEPFPASPASRFTLTVATRLDRSSPPVDSPVCTGSCPDAASAMSTRIALDADLDGLLGPHEAALGLSPGDADSDDDGLRDGTELLEDTDGDGLIDALDCDSDDDGLLDGTEAGLFLAGLPLNTDTTAGCWVGDANTANLPTDPISADTDGGGLADGAEDWNHNGAMDAWETSPTDPTDDADTDGDGIADVLEALGTDGSVDDLDSDGDGIDDAIEGLRDFDGDGQPNFLDNDSDGDGIPDSTEGPGDTDGDGRIDALDLDSDDDGSSDAIEGDIDTDGDGIPDYIDTDSDGDGIGDAAEGTGDWDGDGIPNRVDEDSDNDGIPDSVEGTEDTDGAGSPNYLDSDSDNDGISDAIEGPEDVDGDGDGNYRDTNSDGTGASDDVEGIADADCDGIPNFVDPDDEDSFCDEAQPEPGVIGEGAPEIHTETAKPGAGSFTGGSCSTAPSGGLGALPVLLFALLARRRSPWLLLLLPTGAAAQDLNAQRFAPVVDGGRLVKVIDAQTDREHDLGVWMNHADDPLVFRSATGEELPMLGSVDSTSVVGSVGLGSLRLGAELPIHLVAEGVGLERGAYVGDGRLSGEARLFQSEGLSAGLWADLTVPTGATRAWVGAGYPTSRFGAAVSYETGPVLVALNAGGRTGTGAVLGALTSSPGPVVALGASLAATDELSVALEIDREDWLGNPSEVGAHPMEWLLSGRAAAERAALTIGLGTGLGSGVGAPDFRAVAGLQLAIGPRDDGPSER